MPACSTVLNPVEQIEMRAMARKAPPKSLSEETSAGNPSHLAASSHSSAPFENCGLMTACRFRLAVEAQ